MVVVKVMKSAPPIFFNEAVRSTVSPGSRCPLPLPATSSTIASNNAR
ncbi:MAG: hypothetical protein WBB37_07675 [bacterium]